MNSEAQAKQLVCDVTINVVRKLRGKITKLVRGGCYVGVKEGKGRGKSRLSFGVHRVIRTYVQIS